MPVSMGASVKFSTWNPDLQSPNPLLPVLLVISTDILCINTSCSPTKHSPILQLPPGPIPSHSHNSISCCPSQPFTNNTTLHVDSTNLFRFLVTMSPARENNCSAGTPVTEYSNESWFARWVFYIISAYLRKWRLAVLPSNAWRLVTMPKYPNSSTASILINVFAQLIRIRGSKYQTQPSRCNYSTIVL